MAMARRRQWRESDRAAAAAAGEEPPPTVVPSLSTTTAGEEPPPPLQLPAVPTSASDGGEVLSEAVASAPPAPITSQSVPPL